MGKLKIFPGQDTDSSVVSGAHGVGSVLGVSAGNYSLSILVMP